MSSAVPTWVTDARNRSGGTIPIAFVITFRFGWERACDASSCPASTSCWTRESSFVALSILPPRNR